MRRTALLAGLFLCAANLPANAQDYTNIFPSRLPASLDVRAGGLSAAPSRANEAALPAMSPDPQAIEHSDAYYTRLTIHRYGSYAMLPLFAGQYYLGNKLINGTSDSWVKPTHQKVAYAVAGLFVSNTITGVWNAVESRHEREGRGRRLLHGGLMLAAEAGFAYTGIKLSQDASDLSDHAREHRNAALVSMGIATTGTLVMWLR
jgi:hypothetical protein